MRRLYILLSGEHPTIPKAEVLAILDAEGIAYNVNKEYDQVLIIESEAIEEAIKVLCKRSSMAKECGMLLAEINLDKDEILSKIKELDWKMVDGKTFAVRVKRIKGAGIAENVRDFEAMIGGKILKLTKRAKVKLREPDIVVRGLIVKDMFLVGIKLGEVNRGAFERRRPKRRPFFHPSAMEPRLARAFVNLARTKRGTRFLDPYCGTGGFLIEAGLIGAKVLGGDIKEDMVRGTITNLRYYGIEDYDVVLHDARKLPFRRVDVIATDPPYGRSATTMRMSLPKLIEEFIFNASEVLVKEGFMCIAVPLGINIEKYAEGAGFKIIEEHDMRVHRSLIRRVLVLRKRI